MMLGVWPWAALLLWGTLVAVDLVSIPQALYGRPIVAGAVAGLLVGDLTIGLQLGILLELFALDVLPIGASRYPDFGPATVAAVAAAAGVAWPGRIGLSVLLALVLAVLGGWAMQRLRMANARSLQGKAAALAAGKAGAIRDLHWAGLARDALRGVLTMLLGLAAAFAVRMAPLAPGHWEEIGAAVAVGGGLMAGAGGAMRNAGAGRRLTWLALGALLGVLIAVGSLWTAT